MTLLPKVKLKSLVTFPATVLDGVGIDAVKQNGNYQFNLDFGDFAPPVSSIPPVDVNNLNALLWNQVSDSYLLSPISLLGGTGSGGIAEAPTGGLMYGRQSSAWARAVAVAGDTMTGPLTMQSTLTLHADPVNPLEAATKQYVDAEITLYDTRAVAAAATIPTATTLIRINRFAIGYPTNPAYYIPGSIAGPMAFQEAGGNYWELALPDNKANVLWFGAQPNGSLDAAPAIRAAMSAIHTRGGGSVYIPAGTYYLASCVAGIIFIVAYSNVTLYGDGDATVLKVAGGMNPVPGQTWGFFVIYTANPADVVTNFQLRNLMIDMNGANNAGGNASGAYQNPLLELDHCSYIVVENCFIINHPGSQIIVLAGGSDYVVRNNRFYNVGYNVNPHANDHSSIYINGDNYTVSGNLGFNPGNQPSPSVAVCTFIEVHGSNWTVSDNHCESYGRLGNIAAEIGNCINGVFANNTGIYLVDGVVGFATGTNHVMDQIIVANNCFRTMTQAYACIDFNTAVDSTAALGSIQIKGNSIWSFEADGTASNASAITAQLFGIITIEGNEMHRLSGPGIDVSTFLSTSVVSICDNVIVDCGRTSDTNYQKGIRVLAGGTAPRAIKIGGNTIVNSSTAYMTVGIHVILNTMAAGSKIYHDDVIVGVATPYNVSAPGVTQGPGL